MTAWSNLSMAHEGIARARILVSKLKSEGLMVASKVHDFEESLSFGKGAEVFVRERLSELYGLKFRDVSLQEDKAGVDCVDGKGRSYQIKVDRRAGKTGNCFIEVWSVYEHRKRGWAYTLDADFLLYYLIEQDKLLLLRPQVIRDSLPKWEACYRTVSCKNKTYTSRGVVVPWKEVARVASKVVGIVESHLCSADKAEGLADYLLDRYRPDADERYRVKYRSAVEAILCGYPNHVVDRAIVRARELYKVFLPSPTQLEDQCKAVMEGL